MKKRTLYLIHPRSENLMLEGNPLPSIVTIADPSLTTVAALAPPDRFEVMLCDERVSAVDFERPVDFVGIPAKHGQVRRMFELSREFRRRGVPVIFGGPFVTLAPEVVRGHCDVLVLGEIEGI